MKDLKFSICMPVYNGSAVIAQTLKTILNQAFTNFDLIIVNDNSTDDTEEVIKTFTDTRIRYFKNNKNFGYARNLEECSKKAEGDVIFLMGQDDILSINALSDTHKAFQSREDIGAVTRPYFWFDRDINKPVRAKNQLNPLKNAIVTIHDERSRVYCVLHSLDQLSGLAFRRKFMTTPFHEDIFPCHAYPFVSIFKKYPVVFLKDYTVAVRIRSSQTRSIKSIYTKSPMQTWVDMFKNIFPEPKHRSLMNGCIQNFVATNYVGLIQIRNYAGYRFLIREICLLLKFRPQNFFSFQFWFFSLGCMVMPPFILIPLVDWYKNRVYSLKLKNMKFNYDVM